MKRAIIYRKNNILAISTMSQLYSGAWALDGMPIICDVSASTEIARNLMSAINASKSGLTEDYFDWRNITDPLFKALKIKSNKVLHSQFLCVVVEENNEKLHFIPSKNQKEGRGTQHLVDKTIIVPVSVDDATLIQTLNKAFDLSS